LPRSRGVASKGLQRRSEAAFERLLNDGHTTYYYRFESGGERSPTGRADLDAVLHLGDYIYEYANGQYGDGTRFSRALRSEREMVSLSPTASRARGQVVRGVQLAALEE
jgi:phosphodiesterase/alkaline phosphatase D-like protein